MISNMIRLMCVAALLTVTSAMSGCGGGGAEIFRDGSQSRRSNMIRTEVTGLHRSTQDPVHAVSADDTLALLHDRGSRFVPLSSSLRRIFDKPKGPTVTGDFQVKTISSDGAEGYLVVYAVDGKEGAAQFAAVDYDTPECPGCYWKAHGDRTEYWLWEHSGGEADFEYFFPGGFSLSADNVNVRNYMTYGARTDGANLPSGVATYVGYMYSDAYDMTDPDRRVRVRGNLNLAANFETNMVDGRIGRLETWPRGEDSYRALPKSTRLVIRNAALSNGHVVGDLVGSDSDENAGKDESVRGYEGGVLGEFYGPAAEEFGGVLGATSKPHGMVIGGTLRARRLDPQIPAGTLAVRSTAIDRNYPESTTGLSDTSGVTSIEGDGSSGMHVTYNVEGTDQRIHLGGRDYGAAPSHPGMYFERTGNRDFFLWDYTGASFIGPPRFEHFNASGWTAADFETAGDGTPIHVRRGPVVYGIAADVLPAGTVEYTGPIRVEIEPMDRADHTLRATMRGRMTLSVNFDDGTVAGTMDDVAEGSLGHLHFVDGEGRLRVGNGEISGSGLRADLGDVQGNFGFTGVIDAGFYGPAAAELGGVLNGTHASDRTVVYGWFGGKRR